MSSSSPAALAPMAAPVLRPIPLRQLAWVAWRRNRSTILGLGALLAALATYLVVSGRQIHHGYDALGACVPPIVSDPCQVRWVDFTNAHGQRGLIGPLLLMLPGIVGAAVGAPLIGRELESGVFRYSWTQGVGRLRLAITTVLPVAVLVAAMFGALGLLITWRAQPLTAGGMAQRLDSSTFPTTGVAAVGWTLLGVSIGVLAGLLWRKVVPAMASGFAVWFGLAYLASVVRPHIIHPLRTTRDVPLKGLEVSHYWTKGGHRVGLAEVEQAVEKIGVRMTDNSISVQANSNGPAPQDPFAYLAEHGYSQVHLYQPDSRFWTLQWIEAGWLVLASAALLGLAFWLVQRRSV